jgi:hypothetical protein
MRRVGGRRKGGREGGRADGRDVREERKGDEGGNIWGPLCPSKPSQVPVTCILASPYAKTWKDSYKRLIE